jgi:predicted O-methyltransferase YrrM
MGADQKVDNDAHEPARRAEDAAAEFYMGRAQQRRKSRFQRFLAREVAQAVMRMAGRLLNSRKSKIYLAYRPDSHFDFDSFPHFPEFYRRFVHQSAFHNGGDLPRLYMLLLNVARVLKDDIPGDFAELGVYKGHTAQIIAHAARAGGRRLFLFDTFSGFDAADQDDAERLSRAFADSSLQTVKNLVGSDAVEYVVGKFPESLSGIRTADRFALVHLDCDLYKPTAAGLAYFYPRLSPGGLLIMHDYTSGHWKGCAQAIDEFLKDKPERPILIPDKSGSAILVKA